MTPPTLSPIDRLRAQAAERRAAIVKNAKRHMNAICDLPYEIIDLAEDAGVPNVKLLDLEALLSDLDRAREVVEPFAAVGDPMPGQFVGQEVICRDGIRRTVREKDFRAAREWRDGQLSGDIGQLQTEGEF